KTIVKLQGGITTTLADNDIRAGQYVMVTYDGTNMQMLSASGNVASATPAGSNTQVQYNNSGALGADSRFAFTSTGNGRLDVPPGTSGSAPGLAIGSTTQGFSDWTPGGVAFYSSGFQLALSTGLYLPNANGVYWASGSTPSNTDDAGVFRYDVNTVGVANN